MLGVGRQAGTIRHELSCISTLHLNWDTGLVFVQGHNYQETATTTLIALHSSAQRSDRNHDRRSGWIGHKLRQRLKGTRSVGIIDERKQIWLLRFETADR